MRRQHFLKLLALCAPLLNACADDAADGPAAPDAVLDSIKIAVFPVEIGSSIKAHDGISVLFGRIHGHPIQNGPDRAGHLDGIVWFLDKPPAAFFDQGRHLLGGHTEDKDILR